MPRTVTRDDVLGGDATVAIWGGRYARWSPAIRGGLRSSAAGSRGPCSRPAPPLSMWEPLAEVAGTGQPDGVPAIEPSGDRSPRSGPPSRFPGPPTAYDQTGLARTVTWCGWPTRSPNSRAEYRRKPPQERRHQEGPARPRGALASESDGTLIRAVRTHAPVQPYATAPRRWSPARSRSSAAVRSRSTLHTHAYADLIGAPRKTPEKPGSSTRAQARTRWSGLFAHARGRDKPDELAGAG